MSDIYALHQLLANLAQTSPQAAAISTPTRTDLTFQALDQLTATIHITLRQLGIGRSDRVMLFAPANSAETATLNLTIAASATCIPVPPSLCDGEIETYLQQINPKVIITFPAYLPQILGLNHPLTAQSEHTQPPAQDQSIERICQGIAIPVLQVIPCVEKPAGTFQLVGTTRFSPSADDWAQPEDDAFMILTSGSTGISKLVPRTQDALCYSCSELQRLLQLNAQDTCLNVLPIFHVHGLVANFILPLLAGGKVVFYGSFDPDYFLDWLVDSQATYYSATPTIHLAILRSISENPEKIKNHALRFVRSGSAPLQTQVIAGLEQQLGVPLIQGYGMSEIPLFMNTHFPPKSGDCGKQNFTKISRDSEVAIADELGKIVPNGTVGEIIARGRTVMKGYINNPAANHVAFRAGWFQTGDLGYLDDQGNLYLAGRLKEMINRGGNKISPQEVDNALIQFPEVEEVATFSVDHPRLGEDVVAVVVLKAGTNITVEQLRTRLFDRLIDFKVPSQIIAVDRIPKGKTDKIQRNQLAKIFAKQLQFAYAAPRNELEVKLTELFAKFLNLDKIGIDDNFFLLGGDSLIGTQIISRICQIFAINIPIRVLFELPTVADFAPFISACIDRIKQPSHLEYEEGQL